ncbi:enterobactin synthase subunit EntD [Klebsiella variicola]|uniref:enterobactin synthase subunit EntD n=1 Tax=Klebsiella variicola TaxID=244366 RepID=UPI000CECB967|nr:enterobactin synthase subunit EntD [Klebsiella variicola]HBZ8006844.1 enterobactin synthase subunit EntD [Klebsiella variicola subsp. variicola]ELN4042732.1 enterobactin synthase subunit EntD [Klebsiella variicola]ROG46248.1 enterobactin synthase subunit EntD [Klebsiella variicola]HCB0895608.1 enterobactin synthase subunit EntD [Klebsiella variicola subsp. variicola]HCB0910020.1 enterobactin synthase subunit EntD [Klebsiella variicola subsp. variicola]
MRHHHTALPLAGYTLQQIDFDPATFQPEDLFWLPYHASLSGWGRKRQAEHLAGRIAAVYALREVGEKQPPAIGDQRQPLWPTPWFGSISHCGQRALAVIADRPVGVDIERRFTPQLAAELESSIISPAEKTALLRSGLPFPLALTLAFSAKESGFKAWSSLASGLPGFHSARIVALTTQQIHLRFTASFSLQLADFPLQINHLIKDDLVITCTCPPREA